MPIKHKFQSGRADNGDAGSVQPSEWNDTHDITGMLAVLDALAPTPNVVVTLDGSGNLALQATASFAPTFSPQLTGAPTAPTPLKTLAGTQIATMEVVHTLINDLIGGAPGALDTLQELAAAINNDNSYAATITAALGVRLRVDAAQGLTTGQKSQGVANLGLATVAVSGAYADLAGKPSLATVATSGAYGDLSGRPTLGTAAALNVGTGANQIVQLDANGKLPAVDGSALTGVVKAPRRVIGLVGQRNAATTTRIDLAADGIVTADTSGVAYIDAAIGSLACDISTAGPAAGGRDQAAAFANGSTVHFYFIRQPGGTKALIASLAAPTTGPALPAGYTAWAYATSCVMAAAALPFVAVRGARVSFIAQPANIITGGTATVETLFATTVLVPANALRVNVFGNVINVSAATGVYVVNLGVVSGSVFRIVQVGVQTNSAAGVTAFDVELPNISNTMYYSLNAAGLSSNIGVNGYTVPNGDS